MIIELMAGVTLLSFGWMSLFELVQGSLRQVEREIKADTFFERLNKEKYIEEAGCTYLHDPW
jgi:hypothetical protein